MLFYLGSFYTVANHYFNFHPNKVAGEFDTAMLFAAGYLWIAMVGGGFCAVLGRRSQQTLSANNADLTHS